MHSTHLRAWLKCKKASVLLSVFIHSLANPLNSATWKEAMISSGATLGGQITFFFTAGTPSTTILLTYFWHFSEIFSIRVIYKEIL